MANEIDIQDVDPQYEERLRKFVVEPALKKWREGGRLGDAPVPGRFLSEEDNQFLENRAAFQSQRENIRSRGIGRQQGVSRVNPGQAPILDADPASNTILQATRSRKNILGI